MNAYVVVGCLGAKEPVSHHERVRNTALAEEIASILGADFAGEYDASRDYGRRLYFVPHRTVVGIEVAEAAGLRTVRDFYGGVVPSQCYATKSITHGLVGESAARPCDWSTAFSEVVASCVLPGYAVFSVEDARSAAARLLSDGPVRCKLPMSSGGLGQCTIASLGELESVLAQLDPRELAGCGLVLERHLEDIATFSVGQVQLDGLVASYYGVQRLTPDNRGEPVYGGSHLVVVRGGWDELLATPIPDHLRLAISQVAVFDLAVEEHYPRVLASRRNYDVGQGFDSSGRHLSGVLDQSWRIGGASGPEIAALRLFHNDPMAQLVEASSFEKYGAGVEIPNGAAVHFSGVDPACGPITLYTLVTRMERGAGWRKRSSWSTRTASDSRQRSPIPL